MSDKSLKTNEDVEKLEWIRIFDPIHIPKHLIEQVRDRDWTIEKFYKYQERACIHNDGKMAVLNPFNLLFVLVDEAKKVQGFMWASVDALSNCLVINTFSIEKEYWGMGNAVRKLEQKAKEIAEGAKLEKIYWITNYPKHSERYGFKRSKSILMEYKWEKENGQDISRGGCQAGGTGEPDGSGTVAISSEHPGWTGTTGDGCLPAASGRL